MLEKTTEVYAPVFGQHLGDCIWSLDHLVHKAYELGQCIRISDHYWKNPKTYRGCGNYYQIEPLIQPQEREWFVIVKDAPTVLHGQYGDHKTICNAYRNASFIHNIYQFDKQRNLGTNRITYQFDGRGRRAGKRNFGSKELEAWVIKSIEDMGFTMTRLGWPMSLEEASQHLANSEFFIGVMSGMAWLAATTRTPAFMVTNQMDPRILAYQISGRQTFLSSRNHKDLLWHIRKYKDDREYYDKNCTKLDHVPPDCW